METRKLQQVGGGTYTVSIPKQWADDHCLEAGMELHLYTHADGSIVVRDAETDGGDLATVEFVVEGSRPVLVERALRAAHAAGFETVTLVPAGGAFTDEQRRGARSVVRTLVGADLLADGADELTVGHLLDASNVSVRQSVVQLQFTALSIHEGATAAVVDGDPDAARRLHERRSEADRLARMVERHLVRSLVSFGEVDSLGVSRPELFDYYVTARALARVADVGLELAGLADDVDGGLPDAVAPSVTETAETTRTCVETATTAVLDGATVPTVQAALDDCEAVGTAVAAVERALFEDDGLDPATAVATTRTLDGLDRTADAAATVAGTALRAAARTTDGAPESTRTASSDD